MKKIILGSAMLLSGVIGFSGWMIACTNTVEHGARSQVISCLNGTDYLFAAIFLILAVIGLVIAAAEAKKDS